MAVSTRLSPITVLHTSAIVSAPGAMIDITDATSAVVELYGNAASVTANFEASLDAGATWHPVSLVQLSSLNQSRLAQATADGLYFLEYCRPLSQLRARIVVSGTPVRGMTVRARAALA